MPVGDACRFSITTLLSQKEKSCLGRSVCRVFAVFTAAVVQCALFVHCALEEKAICPGVFFHLIREDCMCIVGPGCQDNFAQREKTVGFAIKLPTRITIRVVSLKGDEFWVWVHCTWVSLHLTGEAVGPAGSRDLSDFGGEELLSGRVLGVYTLGEECGGHSPVAAAGE